MKRVILIILLMFPLFVSAEEVKFDKCIDGDTIRVNNNGQIITVRLLAVDSPEIKHDDVEAEYYGEEAKEYTCNRIKNAKKIELEFDPKSDLKDKYGRTLAWVFVDNYLLNDALIRNGYAKVRYVYDDYKYVDLLEEHEALAKKEKIGIWDENKESEEVENVLIWTSVFIAILLSVLAMLKSKLKKIFK